MVDIGAYVYTSGIATAEVAAAHIANAYRFPNIDIAVRCIGTQQDPDRNLSRRRAAGGGIPDGVPRRCAGEGTGMGADPSCARAIWCDRQDMPYATGTSLFGNAMTFENVDCLGMLELRSGRADTTRGYDRTERRPRGLWAGLRGRDGRSGQFRIGTSPRRSRWQRGGRFGHVVARAGTDHHLRAGLRGSTGCAVRARERCGSEIPN